MKTKRLLLSLGLLVAATFIGLQPLSAKIWYVGTGDQWAGKSDVKASPSEAYTAAAAGDEIWIATGTYEITGSWNLTSKLVSFYGGFVGTEVSIGERQKGQTGKGWDFVYPTTFKQTGTAGNYMLQFSSPNSTVTNVAIDGLVLEGSQSGPTRGIFWNAGTVLPNLNVSIKNCIVQKFGSSSSTVSGGGIALSGASAYGSFIIDSCLIQNNTARCGGGIQLEGAKTIRNCEIRNNVATEGTATATKPESNATAPIGAGGGIYVYQGNAQAATITNCLVEGNTAYSGGGVSIRYNGTAGTAASLHNCIVVNNTAEYGGGVSFCGATSAASSHFSNFTVASNRATEQGGGVYFVHANQRAYNSIFWNNVNVKSGEEVVENVYVHSNATGTPKFYNNIIDKDYDKLTPISGVIASDSAAIFGENWVTLPTSPGVDKGTTSVGDNLTLPIVDYAGNPRITNDVIDIGPYEYMPIPAGLTGLTGQVAKTGVELAWEASEGAAGYRIYKDDGEQSEATTLVAAVPGLSCVVEGLTAATAYTFSVEAFNGGGATPKVSLKLTTLGADAPDQPVSLVPSSVAETSLTLSWNVQGNDASTKYIIYCDGVAVDSVENSSTLNIAGLQVWREYTFTVRAKKVVGDQAYFSLASAPLKVHTADLTPPVAPANLTLTSASKSALSLEWNASSDNGVLAGYIISVSGADTTFTDTLRLAGISDKILTGLNGKMRYRASGLGASIDYTVGIKAFDEASNLSDAANSIFSTNAADEPFIWYVGSWFGKPADRVKDRVDSAFVAAAGVPNAQVWIQGEHTLTYRIAMADKSINGFSFYGGFAGYENSPDERIKVGEKGWEFAHPTKIKRNGDYAIHSSSTNAPEGDIVIDGLVLEGNNFGNFSGIYWNSSSQTTNVSIRNCVVQNFGIEASTAEGGGIRLGGEARHESFVVENCLIQGNNARNGGGISMDGYRTIRNCEIRNNTASTASNVSPTTPDSIAEPRGAGGGIYVYQALGASSITGCIVEGNTAHSGGGIFLRYVADSAGVHNNIIANNTAGYGGGLSFRAVDASRNPAGIVSNLTIASNRATVRGAGVYFADSGQQVYNTIFWSNLNTSGEAPTVENVYVAAGIPAPVFSHNIIDRVDYENLTATACIAEADSAALFGAGWVTLLPGVAADAGIGIAPPAPATAAPATDMAGLLRVVGGAIDIGPYELQAEAGAPSTPQNFTGVARNLTGVRGEGEIILSWVASTPAEGDEVASYTIYLDGNSVQTVPASRTADTLKNLNDGTYLVQLAAVSASGKVSPKTPNDLILDILADSYSVTINESAGITITAPTGTSGKTHTVPLGSSLEVKFTVNAGYENPVVLLDGEPVTPAVSNGEYSLVVESSVSVTLSISVTPIPVVTIAADNVSINVISPSGSSHPTPAGSQLVIQFAPKVGYENPTVTVGNEVVAPVDNGGTYTVTITVTASVTVTISAAPVTSTGIDGIEPGDYVVATVYYNLQGQEIRKPAISGIYILKKTYASRKVLATKRLVIVNE